MNAPDNLTYEFGPFLLDPRARRLSRCGDPVPLAGPEFELLLLLVRKRGQVVEKGEIMDALWPDVEVEENNLTVRMSALRRALGETKGNHTYIQTVSRRGYCLIAEVKELPSTPVTETAETDAHGDEPKSDETQPRPQPIDSANAPRQKRKRFTLYAVLATAVLTTFVLYLVSRTQQARDSEAPAQSMGISRLTQNGRVRSAAVSPDGQNIAYTDQHGELSSLWLQRAGTNNPLQLLSAKLFYRDPSFSRDGNTLYYSKCQPSCELYKIPVLGGVETALGIRADSRVTFSPDGKRMAYVRSDVEPSGLVTARLFAANVDGTGEEFLNWEAGDSVYQHSAPAWSPDGKVIAFSIIAAETGRRRMKVLGAAVADRTISTLISPSWSNIRDVAWLPDGSTLIVNGIQASGDAEPGFQVWRVPLAGGEARRITNDLSNYFSISLSADGETLIALQWQVTSGLWIAPVENPSAATPVTAGTLDREDGHYGVSVAPDGRLVYVSDRSGKKDLWSINADGTGLKQLTDALHKDLTPAVSPDGRYIVFQSWRSGSTGFNLWRIDADGRNPLQLTRGTYDRDPAFSPDGQSVVYVAKEDVPKLRRVPISGGQPVSVTEEFSQHPTFSPDGKLLVYYRMNPKQRDQRHLVFIPAQGGAPVKTLPAPKNFGSVMQWAPAGDSLWYRDNTLSSIWVQPLDGTPPRLLFKLPNQTLSAFSISRDGRRLAYSSGPELSDVVLITRFN